MQQMDIFQFIVPLTFLAIWALTSLLNREAQPLPPRLNRPPGPPGPRPGAPPRPLERPVDPLLRDPAARWSMTGPPPRPVGGRPPGRPDDDILIIEPDPRRGSAPGAARPGGGSPARRGTRPRSGQAAPPKRQETATPRALTAALGQESAAQLNRHLELNPLHKMVAPISAPVSQEVAAVPHTPPKSATLAALSSGEIQGLLGSPARLREAMIVSELLRPPLALRRPRSNGP